MKSSGTRGITPCLKSKMSRCWMLCVPRTCNRYSSKVGYMVYLSLLEIESPHLRVPSWNTWWSEKIRTCLGLYLSSWVPVKRKVRLRWGHVTTYNCSNPVKCQSRHPVSYHRTPHLVVLILIFRRVYSIKVRLRKGSTLLIRDILMYTGSPPLGGFRQKFLHLQQSRGFRSCLLFA